MYDIVQTKTLKVKWVSKKERLEWGVTSDDFSFSLGDALSTADKMSRNRYEDSPIYAVIDKTGSVLWQVYRKDGENYCHPPYIREVMRLNTEHLNDVRVMVIKAIPESHLFVVELLVSDLGLSTLIGYNELGINKAINLIVPAERLLSKPNKEK